ncbi:winged helix-turn-helix domain-containing protein [Streptomyces sp. SID13031]|uniref:ArsR/SmtB family transcription factor n=1 Tax=Streptomyces sp. SID13031 TaxID=2706046 RepID=UPI0013C95C1F|nr:winged helix-turn-helix domain-containing protein [Streptomyces sp. SID13031]NEA31230.1 winged helix-turn-helix transcriptional regulator [Streptomyces sp. SID13031]
MLTLRLNGVDLSHTSVRSKPSATMELAAAGKRITQSLPVPPHLATWAAATRAAIRPVMAPYLQLCGMPRWMPDFLTPTSSESDFATALEQMLATPPELLFAELRAPIESGALPARTADLAAGDPAALRRLGVAAEAFHAIAVGPYWAEMVTAVHADRAARGLTFVDQGIDRVLHTLSPQLRWQSSTLSYECPGGADIVITPAGRGVTLVPSYLVPVPNFVDVGTSPVILHYPIEKRPPELTFREPLSDLLGRTRAAVLSATTGGRSTSEVAEAVGISAGSASQHASVLRSAGLITTHRTGSSVRHLVTPLGTDLLQSVRRSQVPGSR